MIKETPASRMGVVLAFAGTALVAVLPLALLALTDDRVRSAVAHDLARYGGPALLIGGIVVILVAASRIVRSALRRKPRAASI